MAWEQAGTLIAGVTGIAGILATYFTAKYGAESNLRAIEAERRYASQQATVAERKSTYVRMLHSFEEFYFTLSILQKRGYGGSGVSDTAVTKEVHEALTRNLEVDLAIQNIERELELIAPLAVLRACRHAFYALRDLTQRLTNDGELDIEPYETLLATAVSLMRLDLEGGAIDSTDRAIEDAKKDMKEIYGLNAPESAIELSMDSINAAEATGAKHR
jgi:hypothetical protein